MMMMMMMMMMYMLLNINIFFFVSITTYLFIMIITIYHQVSAAVSGKTSFLLAGHLLEDGRPVSESTKYKTGDDSDDGDGWW